MALNLKRLLRDKRVWVGVGVAGLIGVVVLVQRKDAAAGSPQPGGAGPGVSGGYTQGMGDTTGTDIAGYLSQWGTAQMEAQNTFLTSLRDALDGGADGGQTSPSGSQPALYYLGSSGATGSPVWGLKKGGQWFQTGSQEQANAWAAEYMPSGNALNVDQDTWNRLRTG